MKHTFLFALCVLLLALAGSVQAADHRDTPSLLADPAADINDIFVFRHPDPTVERTVFAMTVFPVADTASLFSDAIEYRFNVIDRDSGTDHSIICEATNGTPQEITCTKSGTAFQTVDLNELVTCDVGANTICVFAGLRDDPFYFDLEDFRTVLNSCLAGACDPTALVDGDGTDFFLGLNTLSLVVEIRNSEFGSASNFAVWGSTVRKGL